MRSGISIRVQQKPARRIVRQPCAENTVAGKRKPVKALRWNLYAAGWGNPDTAGGDYAKFCLRGMATDSKQLTERHEE